MQNNNHNRIDLHKAQLENAKLIFLTSSQIDTMCEAALNAYKKNESREQLGELIVGFVGIKNGENATVLPFAVTNDKSWRQFKSKVKELKITQFGISFATAFDHFGSK